MWAGVKPAWPRTGIKADILQAKDGVMDHLREQVSHVCGSPSIRSRCTVRSHKNRTSVSFLYNPDRLAPIRHTPGTSNSASCHRSAWIGVVKGKGKGKNASRTVDQDWFPILGDLLWRINSAFQPCLLFYLQEEAPQIGRCAKGCHNQSQRQGMWFGSRCSNQVPAPLRLHITQARLGDGKRRVAICARFQIIREDTLWRGDVAYAVPRLCRYPPNRTNTPTHTITEKAEKKTKNRTSLHELSEEHTSGVSPRPYNPEDWCPTIDP
ncbi:hypothetical protein EDB92DRAFT_188610 [Lactarius akahatsu]|uniref:Uncharacterized protein n=1 Tax=Lactarius akahatsu TaxID=416441 RepID=A0AAD4L7K5_9AGAM|nr:hypothetical protein EDB92DRAFT_188610 [Lactarius akahatsu]